MNPAEAVPAEFDRVKAIVDAHGAALMLNPEGGLLVFPSRRWRYRGRHRANRFSVRVHDLTGGAL
jgi:hypothetical protein